jgi:hypothetical protein
MQVTLMRARRSDPVAFARGARAQARTLFAAEHAALLVVLLTGALLMWLHGWGLGYPRWLSLKVGLVAFLVVPLEGFHAFVCHVWIPGALHAPGPMGERRRERGAGMEEMIRTLAIPLLAMAIPLIVWLSLKRPF